GKLGCRLRNTWFPCSMDQPELALDRSSAAYTYERALYPHRRHADEPQTRSNPDSECRPAVARIAYVVGEAACHPNVARCFCNSGISVGPPGRAADRRVRTGRYVVCFGTKRTCQSRSPMSAFGGKADIQLTPCDVRF